MALYFGIVKSQHVDFHDIYDKQRCIPFVVVDEIVKGDGVASILQGLQIAVQLVIDLDVLEHFNHETFLVEGRGVEDQIASEVDVGRVSLHDIANVHFVEGIEEYLRCCRLAVEDVFLIDIF